MKKLADSTSLGDAFAQSQSPAARFTTVTICVHGDKDSNRYKGNELGLTGEALTNFSYAAMELELTYEVDRETGEAKLLAVDGRKLEAEASA